MQSFTQRVTGDLRGWFLVGISLAVIAVAGCGSGLHPVRGRVAFAVRHGADEFVEILSPAEVKGSFAVTASITADGTMKLVVAGQDAVSGKAKGALPRQPAEDFCVGHDNGKAVGLYGKLIVLQGTVSGLSVTTP